MPEVYRKKFESLDDDTIFASDRHSMAWYPGDTVDDGDVEAKFVLERRWSTKVVIRHLCRT